MIKRVAAKENHKTIAQLDTKLLSWLATIEKKYATAIRILANKSPSQ